MDKHDIKSFTQEALTALLAEWGEPAFRARQVFGWLHDKRVLHFSDMSNLPKALRTKLEADCYINSIKIEKKLVSALDGTVKYLYGLRDGHLVEAVLMQYRHGQSLCISTQVGCRMGCRFCASAPMGLARGLTASEMLDEVYMAQQDSGRRIDSVVLMGIGEPLDNYDNVLAFLRNLSSPLGLNLSLRHVSLSTCGLVDQIYRLAQEKLPLTLSVSLHAPNDALRAQTMPVAKKWPVEELLTACRAYFAATGRRVSFEYALIDGVNDSPAHAHELAQRLRGSGSHVNLIPVNAVSGAGYRRSKRRAVEQFAAILQQAGLTATVRRELGADISAACGQLRRDHVQNHSASAETAHN